MTTALGGGASKSIEDFRSAFSHDQGYVHLNNAGLMPISKPARDAVRFWSDRLYHEGMHCNDAYIAEIETARAQVAHLINCRADELAFFQSTSAAISQVAFGMQLNAGDEVLMWDQEYSSNLYPWREACLRAGAKLVLAQSESNLNTPIEKLVSFVTAKTRVIAISWVQYRTGAVTNLEALGEFARAKNILTVIDGIQAFGLFPFNFESSKIDIVCGGSHKWLAAPVGVGFMAIRAKFVEKISPLTISSNTYGTCDDPASDVCGAKTSAQKFEAGSKQVLDIIALGKSCELISAVGVENILAETQDLAGLLRRGLQSRGMKINAWSGEKQTGSIVNFSPMSSDLIRAFRHHKMSFAERDPGLRLSIAGFNTEADVDKVFSVIDEMKATGINQT